MIRRMFCRRMVSGSVTLVFTGHVSGDGAGSDGMERNHD